MEKRTKLYGKADVTSATGQRLEGKVVVLAATRLGPDFRKPEFQLWRADSGFGCSPNTTGTAVYSTCIEDGEEARWERFDFLGILKPELMTPEIEAKLAAIKEGF